MIKQTDCVYTNELCDFYLCNPVTCNSVDMFICTQTEYVNIYICKNLTMFLFTDVKKKKLGVYIFPCINKLYENIFSCVNKLC